MYLTRNTDTRGGSMISS